MSKSSDQAPNACSTEHQSSSSAPTQSSIPVSSVTEPRPLNPVDSRWFLNDNHLPPELPDFQTITDYFLWHARQTPDRAIVADQITGLLTFRQAVHYITVISTWLRTLPGKTIGILMPASVASNIAFLSALFAGKIPVMLNWTVGRRNMAYAAESMGLSTVLTSHVVIQKLTNQGTDITALDHRLLFLEDILEHASVSSTPSQNHDPRIDWDVLNHADVPEIAIILFTSGSENFPKTVPLTHENLIANIRSSARSLKLTQRERVLGILPPFHSFGVWLDFLIPDVLGVRTVYHPNPMTGSILSRIIQAYQTTLVVGTPTFVSGIYRKGIPEQLNSIATIVVGAESCPQKLMKLVAEKTPKVNLLEGYGITECSPVISVNLPEHNKMGTLGTVLDCMEWTVRDERLQPTAVNQTGMLYVRGKNVFKGYLHYDGASPFVEIDHKQWFKTGDLVSHDQDGYLTYKGRLTRFVKIGGEMISLPAIEATLAEQLKDESGTRTLAVGNLGEVTKPIITLYTTVPRTREEANKILIQAGFSPLSFIRNVVQLHDIPLLGSGKTDYRGLTELGKSTLP